MSNTDISDIVNRMKESIERLEKDSHPPVQIPIGDIKRRLTQTEEAIESMDKELRELLADMRRLSNEASTYRTGGLQPMTDPNIKILLDNQKILQANQEKLSKAIDDLQIQVAHLNTIVGGEPVQSSDTPQTFRSVRDLAGNQNRGV